MSFLLERDTVHGAAGTAVMIRDGQIQELFGAKKIDARANIASSDMKVIGTKRIQQKPGGAKLTGTGTMYYYTSAFVQMAAEYIRTGAMPRFDMQVTNDDKASLWGCRRWPCTAAS